MLIRDISNPWQGKHFWDLPRKERSTMNILAPRPWDTIAYAFTCVVALFMTIFNLGFLRTHCEWVYQTTGIPGACGLGWGWIIISLVFLAIATYSGREFYLLLKERQGL
ncbi:MAG: hypothetical protein GYA23_05575 [Methanomicrobiales archaeon]|nr:hypothetical protein [Methanomicrobiales archaeon]